MSQRTKHIQIPLARSKDVEQQRFNEAVRQALNMMGGTKADRVLTVRDVMGGSLKGITLTGAIIDQTAQPGYDGENAGAPTIPTNVQGFAGMDITFLRWDRATFPGFAYTEVYRFDADSLALATRIATVTQPQFSEYLGFSRKVFYWVRHVNVAGRTGPFHATNGVEVETKPDYEAIQAALSEKIDESYLAAALRAKIELLNPENDAGLIAAQAQLAQALDDADARLTLADQALDQKIAGASAALAAADTRLTAADASLQQQITAANNALVAADTRLTAADASLQQQITTANDALVAADTRLSSADAALQSELDDAKTLFNDQLTGQASQIVFLQQVTDSQALELTGLSAKSDAAESSILTLQQTSAGHASRLTSIETVNGTQSTNISSLQTTTATHATAITRLGAYDTAANKYAFIKTLEEVDATQASQISGLTTRMSGAESSITTLNSTTATQATNLTNLTTRVGSAESGITELNTTTAGHASRLTNIETVNGTQSTNISSLQTTTATHATAITRLGAYDAVANKYAFIKTLEEVDATQASQISGLTTRMSGAESSITTLNSTTATQATNLTNLTTRVGSAESGITALNTTTAGHASRLTSIETVNGTQSTNISSLQTTTATHATAITRLGAYDTAANKYAFIKTLEEVDATQASQISGLTTRMSGAESSITTLNSTTATQASNLINLTTRVGSAESSVTTLNTTTSGHASRLIALETDNGNNKTNISSLQSTTADQALSLKRLSYSNTNTAKSNLLEHLSGTATGEVSPPIVNASSWLTQGVRGVEMVGHPTNATSRYVYTAQAFAVDPNRRYRVSGYMTLLTDRVAVSGEADPLCEVAVYGLDDTFNYASGTRRRRTPTSTAAHSFSRRLTAAAGRVRFEAVFTGENSNTSGNLTAFIPGTRYIKLDYRMVNAPGAVCYFEDVEITDVTDVVEIQSSILTLQSVDATQASQISGLTTRVGSAESSITTLNSTTATQATNLTNLTTRVGSAESGIVALNSTTAGHASRLTTIETVNGTQNSNISSLQTTTATHATAITRLGAFDTAANKYAFIKTLEEVDATQASQISGLTTRMSGAESSITTLNSTTSTQATNLTNLTTRVGTAESSISSLNTTTSNQASSLSSLSTRIGNAESTIINLNTATANQASSLNALTTRVSTAESSIVILSNSSADQASKIQQVRFTAGDSMTVSDIAALSANPYGDNVVPVSSASVSMIGSRIRVTGTQWLYTTRAFKVDTSRKYKVRLVVKQITNPTVGGSVVYAGVATMDGAYNALTSGPGTHRYCAGSRTVTVANGRQIFEGVITGEGDSSHNEFRPGTVYVRPMLVVNYNGGNGVVEVESIEIRDVTETAVVEDVAKAYTDNKTGEIRAERTIKVQADGRVAGIGLIAGATTGTALYFSADNIAILPPGASSTTGAKLPFIYDSETGTVFMDTTFIRDLTASKISGGVLNLGDGNIRTLVVYDRFSPPDLFLERSHLSDNLARQLAWVDPNAVQTGGTVKTAVAAVIGATVIGGFLSGGLTQTVRIYGSAPDRNVRQVGDAYVDVQLLRNEYPVTVNGESTFRLRAKTYLTSDEALPPWHRTYGMYFENEINGIVGAIPNNTHNEWKIKIVNVVGLSEVQNEIFIHASAFEAFASSGGIIANTLWSAIIDKPQTATRWPAFSEVTGTAAAAQIPSLDASKVTSGTFAAARIPTGISITGNAGTASVLQTARTINGTSFNGSANITTANWGAARTLTIGNTGKSVDGSGSVSWSLAEIGAPSLTGAGASGTWGISITGNAGTVTNGVYTNGSYANPTWITSLAASKLTGTVANGQISGSYTGLVNLTGSGTVDFAKFLGNAGDTASAPSYSWTGDLNTGIWQPGADQIGFATGGSNRLTISTSEAVFGVPIVVNRSLDLSMGSNTRPNGIYVSDLGATVGEVGNPTYTAAITAQLSAARGISLTVDAAGYLYGMRMHTTSGVTGFQSKVRSADKWTSTTNLTIGNSQKAVDGSTNVAWSLSEIGALSLTGGNLSGNIDFPSFSTQNPNTGAINAGWLNNWFRFRFGGASTPQGISISNYDTTTIELNRNGNIVSSGGITSSNIFVGVPSNFWTSSSTVFIGNSGWIGTNGSYATTIANNVYRNNAGGVTFMGTNGVTDKGSIIDLEPTVIRFRIGAASGTTVSQVARIEEDGTFYASKFNGALVGNASTATTLQTARTINGTSFNGSANITTANWGTARTISIGGTSKSVNGGGNVTWSTSEITAGNLESYDTRAVNAQPQSKAARTLSLDFKENTAVGSPPVTANWNYSHVITVAGWNTSEGSGGFPTQLSIGAGGIAFRQATSATTWGLWDRAVTNNETTYNGGAGLVPRFDAGNGHLYLTNWLVPLSGSGLVWNDGTQLHHLANGKIRLRGTGADVYLQMMTNSSTIRGYVYADSNNNIGLLNASGSWLLRAEGAGNVIVQDRIVDQNGVKFMKWSDFTPNMFLTQQFMDENNLNLAQYDVIQASFIAAGVLGANLIATNGFNVVSAPDDPVQRKFTLYPGIANGKIAQGKLFHFRTVNAAGDDDEDLFYIDTQGEGYFKGSLARGNVDSKAISESAKRAINPYYTGDPDAALWTGNQLVGSGGATTGVVSIGNANQTPVKPDERVTVVFEIKDSYGEASLTNPGWQLYTDSTYTITLQRRVGTGSWVNVPGQSTTYKVAGYNTEPYLVEDRDGRPSWEGDYTRSYSYSKRIEFVDEGSLTGRTTELENVQYRLFVNRTVTGIGTSGGLRFRSIEAEKDAFIKNTLQETGFGGGNDLSSILFIDKESGYATYTTQVRRTGSGTIAVTFPKAFKTVHGCTLGYSRGSETGHRFPPRYTGLSKTGVTVQIVDPDTSQLNTVTVTVTGTMDR